MILKLKVHFNKGDNICFSESRFNRMDTTKYDLICEYCQISDILIMKY